MLQKSSSRSSNSIADDPSSFCDLGQSWFDLVAHCWLNIGKAIASEPLFISKYYGKAGDGQEENPNRRSLLELQRTLANEVLDELDSHLWFEDACSRIAKRLSSFEIAPFGDPGYNHATLDWTVIKAVDLAYQESQYTSQITKRGPLNTLGKESVGVYFKPFVTPLRSHVQASLLEKVEENAKLNRQLTTLCFQLPDGRHPLPIIRKVLQLERPSVQFDNEIELAAITSERFVPTHGDAIIRAPGNIDGFQGIRFGIAPFCCIDPTDEERSTISFPRPSGTSFVVKYADQHTGIFAATVREIVASAARQRCDVLVFPELVVSSDLLAAIRAALREPTIRNRIRLVVAGSTWEDSGSGDSGNNVCHLLDGAGNEVGSYYKRVAFEAGDVLEGCVEALDNPGGQTTIVDVPNVGRVVTGICKDLASTSQQTIGLVRDFDADVAIVPAMSRSLERAFCGPLDYIAAQYLAVGVTCNHCGSRILENENEGDIAVSRVVVPTSGSGTNHKMAGSKSCDIGNNAACREKCLNAYRSERPLVCLKIIDVLPGQNVRDDDNHLPYVLTISPMA